MLFNNPKFFLFLSLVVFVLLFSRKTYKKIALLFFSYLFYSLWDWRFLSLILFSTIVDFYVAKKIFSSENDFQRKKLLTISVVVNLGLLAFFKYYNFFADSLIFLFSKNGIENIHLSTLNIILPVGISFYTFQTMSYTIDVYRKTIKPTNNFLDFSIFVSFFPQLVAGPIERAKNLLPQIENFSGLKKSNFKNAGLILFYGYVQKVLIADNLAPLSDACFNNFQNMESIYLLSGLIVFSLQIYFDFAGYSNIARGIAKLLGIELMINFNQPYFSSSLSEFWKRWHISLSQWLRDYLYIPLGGNKKGLKRTYLNLMITMLLGGLWHGASWNFVLWGGVHGIYLIFFKTISFKDFKGGLNKVFNIVLVYLLVLITWIPFRTASIYESLAYMKALLFWKGSAPLSEIVFIIFLFAILFLMDLPSYLYKPKSILENLPDWMLVSVVLIGVFGIILTLFLNQNTVRPFIYFQF